MTTDHRSTADTSERNVVPLPVEQRFALQAKRWAIIVGISKYQHPQLDLAWANRDAKKLYELIQTPTGGGFEPDHIQMLVDEGATTAAITRALRSFLKKPDPEDIVLLYFACHGTPDPERTSITYLLTHDTDPNDISGTALPMREIDLSLRENLLAQKIVIIADTCHSAAIANDGGRDSSNDAGAINAYLEQVSKAKGGVAVLTSAQSSETAREGKQWGGGHGVFTHFLLRGMEGEADGYGRPKDGIVSVGELFEYVRDNVKSATGDQQHPSIGNAAFDPNLPMAITGVASAREQLELGRGLFEVARRLDEKERYLAAASRFSEAVSLSKLAQAPLPEARIGLGQALAFAGDYAGCLAAVEPVLDDGPPPNAEEALLLGGFAQARLGDDHERARAWLKRFLTAAPSHEFAGWTQSYLQSPPGPAGRRFALLVGIDRYVQGGVPPLSDSVLAIRLMEGALRKLGFQVTLISDAAATKLEIASAFADLASRGQPGDTVFVQYSGHALPDRAIDGAIDPYLIVADTIDAATSITATELHDWLRAIPSNYTTLILDAFARSDFIELAKNAGRYHVLIGSPSRQGVDAAASQINRQPPFPSQISNRLVPELMASNPDTLTLGELLARIHALPEDEATAESGPPPDPDPAQASGSASEADVFVGNPDDFIFGTGDLHYWAYEFAQRRTYPRETVDTLRARRRRVPPDLLEAFPALDVGFGRAFLEHAAPHDAGEVLAKVASHAGSHESEALRLLTLAQVTSHRLAGVSDLLRRLAKLVERPQTHDLLVDQAERLAHPPRFALLVGINDYRDETRHIETGAGDDVTLVANALVEQCGFESRDITRLVDEQATSGSILEAFHKLADIARTDIAVFYFRGMGSGDTTVGTTGLVPADGRGRTDEVPDITIAQLIQIVDQGDLSHLISIVDVNHLRSNDPPLPQDGEGHLPQDRRIGFITFYTNAASATRDRRKARKSTDSSVFGLDGNRGGTTRELMKTLRRAGPADITYRQLAEAISDPSTGSGWVDAEDEVLDIPVFEHRGLRQSTLQMLERLDDGPIDETVRILRRQIGEGQKQNDWRPISRLDLGVATSALGDYAGAIDALERALSLLRDPTIVERERARDPRVDDRLREAYYHLGRVLFLSGTDYTKAVSELDRAVEVDPLNARARYYLGQAVIQMVQRETLEKATKALRAYVEMGAPLGDESRVREFLDSRMGPKERARYLLQRKMQEQAELAAYTSDLHQLRHQALMDGLKNIR